MSLLKNFATVGGGTASSRVLGFVRDMLIAAAVGTGPVAEAYFVAQRLPNLFRRLFAEGAFSTAFIPIFSKTLEGEGKEAAEKFGEEAMASLAAVLLIFTIVAEIAMVWLTFALAPGFAAEPEKFDLAVLLSRIAFPYLAFISLAALLSGALNALGRFAAAAFAPALLNFVLIGALVYVWFSHERATPSAGIILTAAATIGGALQLGMLAIACARANLVLRLRAPRLTPNMKRLLRLAGPSVIAGGIVQINVLVGTVIASLQAGAVSWLYYADRLYQLPLGIVGIAIATVLLPELSRALRSQSPQQADQAMNRSIEFAAALTLPAAVALLVIPGPIIAVLFERGAFTAADTAATAPTLAAYALGLPAFVAIKVLQPGFFAREDTAAPMRYGAISMVVNVVLAFALFYAFGAFGYGQVGIAMATTVAAWVNTGMLFVTLKQRGHFLADAALKRRFPLLCLAAMLMGAGLIAIAWLMNGYLTAASDIVQIAALAVLCSAGLALFLAFCQIVGAFDFRVLGRRLLKRSR